MFCPARIRWHLYWAVRVGVRDHLRGKLFRVVRRISYPVIMVDTPRIPGLTLADADRLVDFALQVVAEREFPPLAVAVVDLTGAVIVLRRADGGMPMTSRIAVAKARTALHALRPTGTIDLPGEITDTIQHLYHGDFLPKAGGVPYTKDR